jgi:hypothetical protein
MNWSKASVAATSMLNSVGTWAVWNLLWGILTLLASANAQAQNLSNLYNSTGFIVGFGIIPLVLALLFIIRLLIKPSSRTLVWKVVLAWVLGVITCYIAVDSALGLLAYILIVLCPWIGVVILAITFFRHGRSEA